jgi:putative PEP-CTERM system histidine kinase
MSVNLTDLAFLTCAGAYAVLAISLRPGATSGGVRRVFLRLAALGTVAWTAIVWLTYRKVTADSLVLVVLPGMLSCLWLTQLGSLARWQHLPQWLSRGLVVTGASVLVLGGLYLAAAEQQQQQAVRAVTLVSLLLSVLGIVAIEQLYRNSAEQAMPAVRWLSLGIGGILVTELVAQSEKLLTGETSAALWPIRSCLLALAAMAIMRGASRVPNWEFGMTVSRSAGLHIGSFLLIGGYLLLMSVCGYLMLTHAGGWHPLARLAFTLLAALLLAASLFSGRALQWFKVWITTHFYAQRYDYRAEWLRFSRTLSGDGSGLNGPQRALSAIAQIVESPAAVLWRRDQFGQRFECTARWPENDQELASVAVEEALPRYLARTAWLVDLAELRDHPGMYGDLQVPDAMRALPTNALIVPLLHAEQLYGWVALERSPALGHLDFEDRDLLKVAGRQVAAHLAQFDSDARLAEAHQFETYNRTTAFVMHDLKNIAAQLQLISQNAGRHRQNPEFVDDSLNTVASAASRMMKLISQLASGSAAGATQIVELAQCAERAALRCGGGTPVPVVAVTQRGAVLADMERLTGIIEHAIRNAQDATPASGEVRIEVDARSERPTLSVVDTGAGMDAAFIRDRLFRPFDTTKGSKGMGIGAFQIRDFLRSLGGEVEVASQPGKGTRFVMLFPPPPVAGRDQSKDLG